MAHGRSGIPYGAVLHTGANNGKVHESCATVEESVRFPSSIC